ncbi:MAG: 3-oxoacyl-[acyl-carrier-protein] reductase [Verrucomicrobia bacterium]|jgi:NAD(P)-dependent dehydrogenase (short-subunit alcohol dehydrogenase family)|nr:3-oxoacyl-[acyl-carrier-protein] reductase [Verrucomicrobiota bacterium]
MMGKVALDLGGKTALVTGGGSGIGLAIAELLAGSGASVAVLDRNETAVNETLKGLKGDGHLGLEADVAREQDIQKALVRCQERWAHLDILVINAGINGVWCPLGELETAEWDQTMAVNLRGTFLTLKLALPLLRQRGGSVSVVASINGTRMFNNYGATAYACSKAAQVAFAKMTALELAPDRIRVNVVCPGAIDTNIDQSTTMRNLEKIALPPKKGYVPLTKGKAGTAEQVAQVIGFLASDAAAHITGTEIYVDGAQSLLGT